MRPHDFMNPLRSGHHQLHAVIRDRAGWGMVGAGSRHDWKRLLSTVYSAVDPMSRRVVCEMTSRLRNSRVTTGAGARS